MKMSIDKNLESGRNLSIDVGRFIASFLVVCLHTKFPIEILRPFVSDIAKIAVPFFFLVSGFYLFNDNDQKVLLKIQKSLKKLIYIIIEVVIIYTILRIVKEISLNIDLSAQKFELVPFLIFNDSNFTEHLWYLFAFLYVLLILKIIYKYNFSKYINYYLPFLISVHLFFSVWSRIEGVNSGLLELNWFVTGLPFVIIGIIINKYFYLIFKIKNTTIIIYILIFSISVFVEHFLFKKIIGRGPGVFSVFLLAVSSFIFLAKNPFIKSSFTQYFGNIGFKHSLNIYLYHVIIREILTLSKTSDSINNSIIIFILSLLFSIIINTIKSFISKFGLKKTLQ